MAAKQLLVQTNGLFPRPGWVWVKTVEWTHLHLPYRATRLPMFVSEMDMPGMQPVTIGVSLPPQGETGNPGEPSSQSFHLSGLALFRRDRLVGWFDRRESLGWALLGSHVRHDTVALPHGSHTDGMEMTHARTKIRLAGPEPRFDVRIEAGGHLVTVLDPVDFTEGGKPFAPYEEIASKELLDAVKAAILRAQESGTDPFGFGEKARISRPDLWRQVGATWDVDGFRHAAFDYDVKVSLESAGLTIQGTRLP